MKKLQHSQFSKPCEFVRVHPRYTIIHILLADPLINAQSELPVVHILTVPIQSAVECDR